MLISKILLISKTFLISKMLLISKMSLIIKIEKIKHRYEEYDLSFATFARGLPEQAPQ